MPKRPPKWLKLGTTETVKRLKEVTGIDVANWTTCAYGAKEFDGENCEYYCGMVCGRLPDDPLRNYAYLEDYGIDPEVEKTCWEPEFWSSQFTVDAFEPSQREKARRRFKETVEMIVNQNK